MDRQELSHGFHVGVNNITISKICKWQNVNTINWKAFLWYIADYSKIVGFSENWFKVLIVSEKQLNFFYDKVIGYQPELWEHNFLIDSKNELWKTHKKGAENNFEILNKLTIPE